MKKWFENLFHLKKEEVTSPFTIDDDTIDVIKKGLVKPLPNNYREEYISPKKKMNQKIIRK